MIKIIDKHKEDDFQYGIGFTESTRYYTGDPIDQPITTTGDYKLTEYVRVRKDEYEELKNNINLVAKKHDKLLLQNIQLQSKLDKIKDYCDTHEPWHDFDDILSIIENDSE